MKLKKLAVITLLATSLSGCGTLISLGIGGCSPYSGIRIDLVVMDGRDVKGRDLKALGIVDMPFSFVADTVLLPVTAICMMSK